jgi:S1-C subfamily serine protease
VKSRAALATVKVVNADTRTNGSGVLIARKGPYAYVLTAAHVVAKGKKLDVTVLPSAKGKAKTYRAELLGSSDDSDVAVLRLATEDDLPAPLPLCRPGDLPKKAPAVAASGGWAAGDAPTVLEETITRKALVRRSKEKAGVWCWEAKRKQELGRSGGALLDGDGRVIGLASGHDGKQGYYVHAEEVHRVLERNGLGWLFGKGER